MAWDEFAALYEWEFEQVCTKQKEDVAFWIQEAEQVGGPILDLACGGGRITVPLARQGHKVTGMDISANMLALAKAKRCPDPPRLMQGDMTSFKLYEKFRFIIIGYSSFQLLLTLEDQLDCLRCVYEHLEDRGVLGLDLNPAVCDGPDSMELNHTYTKWWAERKCVVSMYSSYETDRVNKIRTWSDRYDILDRDGDKTEMNNEIAMRDVSLDYIQLLLKATGMKVVDVWGSLQHGPLTPYSNNMLILANKA